MPIKAVPYKHQIKAFNFVCEKFGLIPSQTMQSAGTALLMEMGTGKTIASIAVTGALYKEGRIRRVLVVAPLSILGVWREEFEKFADFDYTLVVLTGSGAKKTDTLRHMRGTPLQVAVINYESAWRLEKELTAWNPDLIIADEGHKIKTHNIAVSKAMHRLGARARYRLLLTGTVITNKAIDVFSQYKFLNSTIFGQSFYVFRNRYFDMVGYGQHTPVLKKSMEQDLMKRLHSIAFRATKAECLDLPETTDIVRYVELEPAAMKIYRDLVKDSYTELGQSEVTVTNILTRLLRLSQLTGGFLGDDEGNAPQRVSTAKQEALEDIVEDVLQEGKKLVIMARFIPEINAICRMLEKKEIGFSLIMGGVKDREEQVAAFQNDPEVQVFVGQIATAGLGVTLTAASTMVFYSLDYSMSNFEQAKARIHRVGQKENCTYLYLTAKGTVDEKVLKALRNKADLARMLVDDYQSGLNPFAARG
ncbi:helicase SNF2 [Clostridium thermosuccinogenes]|uniref:Helicase SNF2 n=2 Tax=Clostridium thermosuccinogenes TaxID=84032 RepID=A0A2K2FGF5_9CLOT|nr:helicase SNF2 [Pseudoclostridium thermosuccinogenes]PNT94463.1 helicase SNF2 [Pseudoclostridium thermosuccinogenes]PNT96208.1 helicase SNF2 [Pseudoclostridium thermosuccinogenes]PNT97862.1 helicase SNF2 [Pseudoclostridium thermosuccinogenes]